MPDGEPVSTRDHKRNETEKSVTHRSWRAYTTCLLEPHGDVKVECRQRRQDLWHMTLAGLASGAFFRIGWGWSVQTTTARLVN